MAGCPLVEEEMKRVILHTLNTLRFTHPTGIVESNLITAMLKIKMHTLRTGRVRIK